ncbi:unnamed protein product, partial [Brassica rapa subsp. trilocularis]
MYGRKQRPHLNVIVRKKCDPNLPHNSEGFDYSPFGGEMFTKE